MLLKGTRGVKGMEIRTERGIVLQKHLKQPVTTDESLGFCKDISAAKNTWLRNSVGTTTIIHDKHFQMN